MADFTTEPVDLLLHAAMDRMRAAAKPLRAAGWDARLIVENSQPGADHFYDVCLRIRIMAPGPIPDEARKT